MIQYFSILSVCLTLFLFSAGTHADTSITPNPDAIQNYCALRADPMHINFSLYKPENRIAFPNPDGEWGIGICWWMTRFQRALAYSAIFEGGAKHYTDCQLLPFNKLEAVFTNIINNRPTRIACYNNIRDFTKMHQKQLIHLMSLWQKHDTYWGGFLKGAYGSAHMPASVSRDFVEKIYDEVEGRNRMTFAMLQTIGPGTHGWLVIKAAKESDGIILDVVDSNYPDYILRAKYTYGNIGFSFPRDLIAKIETPTSTPGSAPGDPPIYKPHERKKPKPSFYRQFTLIPFFEKEGAAQLSSTTRYCKMLGQN
jgi:hypothetical protein